MKQYILNGQNMSDREAAYDEIARALELPAHFGRNLDALWDELSGMQGEIILTTPADHDEYAGKILQVLREAADENPRLKLNVQA